MWSDVVWATSTALSWFFLVATGFYAIRPQSQWWFIPRWSGRPWSVVLLATLLARLLPMLFLPVGAGYDIESFHLVGEALLSGEDVYTSAAIHRHPYLPLQMYLIGLALFLAQLTPLPFVVWVKMPPLLADVAITALIYRAGYRQSQSARTATLAALLYALNPISVLVSAYHGQFDAIPVLLLLLAWYYWHFGRRCLPSAIALGFAVLSKTWPIVLLPIVLIRLRPAKQLVLYTAVTLLVPISFTVAYIIAFRPELTPMLGRALTHTGPDGYWGLSALLAVGGKFSDDFQRLYETMVAFRRWLLAAAGLLALWFTRKQAALDALTTVLLCVFAVSSGMGIQWLLWLVPFAILAGDTRWLRLYSLAGMLFLLVQLYGLHMYPWAYHLFNPETADTIIRLGSIPAWITVLLWAGHRLLRPDAVANQLRPLEAMVN